MSVGLNSFGPNPTANFAGAKERGHSELSGSVSGQTGPDRAARSGQPHAGYVSAATLEGFLGRPADLGPVTASPLWV
jgi:hypothetical protein